MCAMVLNLMAAAAAQSHGSCQNWSGQFIGLIDRSLGDFEDNSPNTIVHGVIGLYSA